MIYLKFEAPQKTANEGKRNKLREILAKITIGILKKIIPEANPDYDNRIDDVKTWLIEIDEETNLPNREIGLDENGNVIMIMPDDRNYGYWTDNNLKKEDFENHFETEEKDSEEFDELWNKLEKKGTDANTA
jgi:hypothetical protein